MIFNYKNFILEKQLVDLILESKINLEFDFIRILNRMSISGNQIAKELLKLNSTEVDIDNNFIKLTDKNDAISFVSDKRASKSPEKWKIRDNGYCYSGWNEMYVMMEVDPEDRVSSLDVGTIGTIKAERRHPYNGTTVCCFVSDDGKSILIGKDGLEKAGIDTPRSEMKVGRFIKKILDVVGFPTKPKDIEEFVNQFKSEYDMSKDAFYNLMLVEGEDIRKYYNAKNYDQTKGSLGGSCMRYDTCQSYLDIYVENPEKIKLLVYFTDEGKVKGRALVWKLDQPENVTFMDRIYTNNDSDVDLFKKYAMEKEWIHRKSQNSGRSPILINRGGEILHRMGTQLDSYSMGEYPYMDTMLFMTREGYIHNDGSKQSFYMMRGTEGEEYYCGECDSAGGRNCDECGGDGTNSCYSCSGAGEVSCEECGGEGHIDCDDCAGSGETDCDVCDSQRELDCPMCTGSGYDELDVECTSCKGSGKVPCHRCSESGTIPCPNCSNKGTIKCDSCEGDGSVECAACGGNGLEKCDNCYGNGKFNCPECGNVSR